MDCADSTDEKQPEVVFQDACVMVLFKPAGNLCLCVTEWTHSTFASSVWHASRCFAQTTYLRALCAHAVHDCNTPKRPVYIYVYIHLYIHLQPHMRPFTCWLDICHLSLSLPTSCLSGMIMHGEQGSKESLEQVTQHTHVQAFTHQKSR